MSVVDEDSLNPPVGIFEEHDSILAATAAYINEQGEANTNANEGVPDHDELITTLMDYYDEDEDVLGIETGDTSPSTEDSLHKTYLNSLPAVPLSPPARRIPVVYNLAREECGTSQSTENRYSGIWKYWYKYCLIMERPLLFANFGLAVYAHKAPEFTPGGSPSADDYYRPLVYGFYKFLLGADVVLGRSTMTNVASFLNAHIKAEYLSRHKAAKSDNPRAVTIKVGEDLEIQRFVKQARQKKAKSNRDLFLDIQANIDNRIAPQESGAMLWMAAGVGIVANGHVSKKNNQQRLVFAATYTASAATLRRGEDSYSQNLYQRFVRTIKSIGPYGTKCTFLVTNKAKHNTMGRIEYIAMAPHTNPMMEQSFWHGLLWLHLLLVANTPFPDFADWKKLFLLPTYPTSHMSKHFSRQQYRVIWLSFFSDAQVYVGKLTHIWRGQGQQELSEQGITASNIGRMTGHTAETGNKSDGPTKSQALSYITNPPTDGVVGRAGGNGKDPSAHCPPRETVHVSSGLLQQIPPVAKLIQNLVNIQAQRASCNSFREVQDQRLTTASGTLSGVLNDIESVFKCLASRPVDWETDQIITGSQTLFELMRNTSSLRDILSHEVFTSAEFASFCQEVKAAEDRSLELTLAAAHSTEKERLLAAGMQRILAAQDRIERVLAGQIPISMATNHTTPPISDQDIVVDLPLPRDEDHLGGSGGPRKRRRSVDQREVLRAEEVKEGIPRPLLVGVDNNNKTYRDFIDQYIEKWRPYEVAYGSAWRADITVKGRLPDSSEKGHSPNARNAWFNVRKPLYQFFEHKMSEHGMTKEQTIVEGQTIFESAMDPQKKQQRPTLKAVKNKFVEALTLLGIRTQSGGGRQPSIILEVVTQKLASARAGIFNIEQPADRATMQAGRDQAIHSPINRVDDPPSEFMEAFGAN